MKPEDYTPESICARLGVEDFAQSWRRGLPSKQLRVLLAPSFHSPVCITLSKGDEPGTSLEVAIGGPKLSIAAPSLVSFKDVERRLKDAMPIGARPGITLDGMPVFIAYRSGQAEARASGFPGTHDELRDFVAELLQSTWHSVDDKRVRDTLGEAARYVNTTLG